MSSTERKLLANLEDHEHIIEENVIENINYEQEEENNIRGRKTSYIQKQRNINITNMVNYELNKHDKHEKLNGKKVLGSNYIDKDSANFYDLHNHFKQNENEISNSKFKSLKSDSVISPSFTRSLKLNILKSTLKNKYETKEGENDNNYKNDNDKNNKNNDDDKRIINNTHFIDQRNSLDERRIRKKSVKFSDYNRFIESNTNNEINTNIVINNAVDIDNPKTNNKLNKFKFNKQDSNNNNNFDLPAYQSHHRTSLSSAINSFNSIDELNKLNRDHFNRLNKRKRTLQAFAHKNIIKDIILEDNEEDKNNCKYRHSFMPFTTPNKNTISNISNKRLTRSLLKIRKSLTDFRIKENNPIISPDYNRLLERKVENVFEIEKRIKLLSFRKSLDDVKLRKQLTSSISIKKNIVDKDGEVSSLYSNIPVSSLTKR